MIRGEQADYAEFKRLMMAFVGCRLRNMRPKPPFKSIKVAAE